MANTSIVQGLFGIDPTQYAAQQNQLLNSQAAQFAELDPFQKANFGLYKGGSQLANLGAGLMGAQDPLLQKATMAKQLAGQFDLTTPQGLQQYAKALADNGAPDLAQMAVARAQEMGVQNATMYGKTREHLSTMGKLVQERDALINANPKDPRIAEYNKVIAAEGTSKAPQLSLDMKMFDAAASRRDAFVKEVDPLVKQGSAINQALTLIGEGTPFAQAAFENTVVGAFGGDKQKSVKEINRLVNTGDLGTRVENSLRKFTTGKISDMTKDDQQNVLEAIQGGLKRQYNDKQQTIIRASSKVPELKGQEDFYAPSWESSVGGGAARGQKAYTTGETFNLKGVGPVKVLEVDATGKPTKVQNSKGEIGTPQ